MAGNNLLYTLDVDTKAAAASINDFFNTFEQGAAQAKSRLNTALGQGVTAQVKIEFKNGQLVAKEIANINTASEKLGNAWKAVNGELGKTPNQLKTQLSILKGLLGDTQRFKTGTAQVTAEWKQLTDRIKEVSRELKTLEKGGPIQQFINSLQGLTGKFALVQTLSNAFSNLISQVTQAAGEFFSAGAELQVLGLQLEAFTGSSESADAAFKQFQQTAAQTKFNVEEIARAGQILLAYGVNTETAIEATDNLAIAASATGGDVNLLARNLGQAASQGRAYTRDLIQFAIQGIPIWDELAIVTGKSTAELKDLAKEGKIGFDEVNQALKNLTQEGSAFREIANRIQETWVGQLRVLESAVLNLAKTFVETASAVDSAFGAPVANSIAGLAATINFLAENWRTVTSLIVGATVATATFLVVSNFGAILNVIRGLITAYNAWKASISAAAIAQAVLQGLLGNWVAIGAALAAGTVVAVALNSALGEQADELARLQSNADAARGGTDQLSEAQLRLAEQSGNTAKELAKEYREALAVIDEKKAKMDEEIEKGKELKKEIQERYKEEIEKVKEKNQVIKDSIAEEKQKLTEVKEAMKERYDAEKQALDDKLQKVREIYDQEIDRLEALTPAEQKLKELRKEELQTRANNLELTEKERLEAQAALERMERTDEIQKLRNEKKEEEKQITEEVKQLEEEYKQSVKDVESAFEDRIKVMERALKANEEVIKGLESEMKEFMNAIDESTKASEKQRLTLDQIPRAVQNQVTAAQQARAAYEQAKDEAYRLKQALDQAAASARALAAARQAAQNSGGGYNQQQNRFAGGPVAGGSKYTVNELGKEAFLSASGKLSMINAPAWGTWQAPSAGTVIPAHLTKQLDIPTGGVSLNSATRGSAAKAGGGNGMASIAKAIMGAMGGDSIQNNVTIQSANTTKAASDILVELTKIRRRRYS
jgi:tape measure domain-containing protein